MRYTICVDFDGVLHSYTSPFDPDCIPDPPVPGAIEWLREMARTFDVVIFTTRANSESHIEDIWYWLGGKGITSDEYRHITISNVKPAALIYLDDRAVRFTGDNFPTAQQIHQLRPWNKPQPIATEPQEGQT